MKEFREPKNKIESVATSSVKRDVKRMSAFEFNKALHRDTGYACFFTDPSTGEDLPLDRLPDFLLQDKDLKTGYEFLKEFHLHIDIQIIFAGHKPNSPEELGDEQFGFETRVKESDIVLFEGVSWRQKEKELLNDLSAGKTVDNNELTAYTAYQDVDGKIKPGNTLKLRELNAISRTGVKVSFYDVEDKNDEFGIRSQIIGNTEFTEIVRNAPVIDQGNKMQGEEAEVAKNIALATQIISLEALREWYMLTNAGYQIAEACHNNPDLLKKLGREKIKTLMLVGESHRDLVRKFEAVGVSISSDSPTETSDNPVNQKISKWLAQGFIDKEELKEASK